MGNFMVGALFGIIVSSVGLTKVAEYIDTGVSATKNFVEQRIEK